MQSLQYLATKDERPWPRTPAVVAGEAEHLGSVRVAEAIDPVTPGQRMPPAATPGSLLLVIKGLYSADGNDQGVRELRPGALRTGVRYTAGAPPGKYRVTLAR